MSDEVFLDTSALLAIVNRFDSLHSAALSWNTRLAQSKTRLVSSEWVLAEFLGGACREPLRAGATKLVADLRGSSRLLIEEATHTGWKEAFDFYVQYHDKQWSLVDCSSMLICRERGITRVFTHDKDFEQFGLTAMLRS